MNNKLSADELKKVSGGKEDLNALKEKVLALPDSCLQKQELIHEVNALIDLYAMSTKTGPLKSKFMKLEAKIDQEKEHY